jgi:hypothetical protein
MLRPSVRSALLALATLLALPVTSRVAAAQGTVAPFESWLRIAGQLDKPLTAVSTLWPLQLSGEMSQSSFALTPADRLVIDFAAAATARDATKRVARVLLIERLVDSLSLRSAVQAAQQRLTTLYGAPDSCAGAPGVPSHLFAPQETSRIWTKGVGGTVTRLTWEVTPTREYSLTVSAGRFVGGDTEAYPCSVRVP